MSGKSLLCQNTNHVYVGIVCKPRMCFENNDNGLSDDNNACTLNDNAPMAFAQLCQKIVHILIHYVV